MKTELLLAFTLLTSGASAQIIRNSDDRVRMLQMDIQNLRTELMQTERSRPTVIVTVPAREAAPTLISGESDSQRASRLADVMKEAKESWRLEWSAQNPLKNS